MSLSILYSPYKTAWPARALIAWGTFGRGRLIYVTSIVHLKLLHNFLKSHLYFLLIPCSVSELFPAHTFSRIAGSNTGMSINTILPVRTFAVVQIKTQGCPPTLTVPCVSAQEQNQCAMCQCANTTVGLQQKYFYSHRKYNSAAGRGILLQGSALSSNENNLFSERTSRSRLKSFSCMLMCLIFKLMMGSLSKLFRCRAKG